MDDTLLAIILSLFSAVTLAAANMLVKMGSDILVTRAAVSCSAALIVLPVAFLIPAPNSATWLALGLTIPAHFIYQLCLVNALGRGDLSLVFPMMRGAAPLLTALVAFVVLDEALAPLAWMGLILATVAVIAFVLPPSGVGFREHPHVAAIAWAAATAAAIAVYNVTDARGVRIAPEPITFIIWLFLLDCIPITLTALLRRPGLPARLKAVARQGFSAGALSVASFGAAVYAFSLTEAAKVSALRETSVVIAALLGHHFLGEGLGGRRIAAAMVLAAGLILMQFGG
ncbi:DMT family transporter [Sphingosinicella terrae]|uniref:DMT family transporter n=1 Tax=Sphingosinicella terrae TaxID=2172047 RepID=UPI000E0D1514|nr:DMT family transporter [Sphingosinicella terrae]